MVRVWAFRPPARTEPVRPAGLFLARRCARRRAGPPSARAKRLFSTRTSYLSNVPKAGPGGAGVVAGVVVGAGRVSIGTSGPNAGASFLTGCSAGCDAGFAGAAAGALELKGAGGRTADRPAGSVGWETSRTRETAAPIRAQRNTGSPRHATGTARPSW